MKITKSNKIKLICSSLLLLSTAAHADINNICLSGLYIGAFGGGGKAISANASQQGTVFFPAALGGTLVVNAHGDTDSPYAKFAGIHLGLKGNTWQFGRCGGYIIPAAELEAYYLRSDPDFTVVDTTSRITNHTFDDSMNTNTSVFLANGVLSFKFPSLCRVYPYIGGGLGAAYIRANSADSAQVNPPEAGVNHFNSDTSASDTVFAVQGKAGINFDLTNHLKLFAEYRYLYLAPTNYTFGSTVYPTHATTTNWKVHLDRSGYNLGDAGLEFVF